MGPTQSGQARLQIYRTRDKITHKIQATASRCKKKKNYKCIMVLIEIRQCKENKVSLEIKLYSLDIKSQKQRYEEGTKPFLYLRNSDLNKLIVNPNSVLHILLVLLQIVPDFLQFYLLSLLGAVIEIQLLFVLFFKCCLIRTEGNITVNTFTK